MLGSLVASCEQPPEFPLAPIIANPNLVQEGSGTERRFLLSFDYTDGDGNLGQPADIPLPPPFDTLPNGLPNIGNYNLIIELYEVSFTGRTLLSPEDTNNNINAYSYSARIPPLTEVDYSGPIEGQFTYTINFPAFPGNPIVSNDIVEIDFFLVDRAGNSSNTLTAGPLAVE